MEKLSKEDYNKEPVIYCSECLSLRILSVDGIDYCDKCGSTSMEEAPIEEWEEKYANKYGGNYLKMNK